MALAEPLPTPLSPPSSSLPRRLSAVGEAVQGRVARWVGSLWFWALWVVVIMGTPMVKAMLTPPPPPLPVLGQLADFHLVNQAGQKVSLGDLHGHVWVADFIFSRCPSICPLLTEKMAQLQHRARNLGDEFNLVSISVDPTYDTPEVLTAYAREHHANARRWTFLTGPTDEVQATVVKGFKVAMGHEPGSKPDDFLSIVHGSHFVLVDSTGQIRGYYDSTLPEDMDRVMHDAGLLINRGG